MESTMVSRPWFESAQKQLELQYQDIVFLGEPGDAKSELFSEFQQHCASNPGEPRILTKAWFLNLLCRRARIAPEPDDYFVGKIEHHNLLLELRDRWCVEAGEREFGNDPEEVPGAYLAQLDCSSHVCPDWVNLMEKGVRGIRDEAAGRSGVYYQAVTLVFDGMITLLQRFDAAQPELGLAALAQRPPRTFYEALQLAYLYHELIELDGIEVRSMGLFDAVYNRYYLVDFHAGRLLREQAKELLKYFWIKLFAKTMGKRFGKPFTFGPVPNELSYLALEAYREMRIVDPKFHIRISPQTPHDFKTLVAECIEDGSTSMVIVNNDAHIAMLEQNGKSHTDAEKYILIGCCEPAVMGQELNCSGACGPNLAKPIEQLLSAGDYQTFEELLAAYFRNLDDNITAMMDKVRRWETLWPEINPSPLLSGAMKSCFESGRDISQAGAKYNTTGACCVGLANAVDSLAAIRKLIYEDQSCTLDTLRKALAANWDGYEYLRLLALQRVAKWGNNDAYVDEIAVQITDYLGSRINCEPNARGGVFQAALYGIIVAARHFGSLTGALPDGHLAGEPLTMNTGATPGMDRNGITSLIHSVTKVDLSQFPNGTVLDVMLHPSVLKDGGGPERIISVIQGHFAQGGIAIQFNVFDADVLRNAQKNPEKYSNLQVRVCGWNVHFADLTSKEQDIFITKAEVA